MASIGDQKLHIEHLPVEVELLSVNVRNLGQGSPENAMAVTDWIAALSQLGMFIAVALGVCVGYRQLHTWRSEHLSKRLSETAEHLLSKAINVKLAISSVRSAMEQVPVDAENSLDATIEIKSKRLMSYKEDFDRLRDLQVLHEALTGSSEVKEAVETLFDVRQEVYAALTTLSGWDLGINPKKEDKELHIKLRWQIYSTGGKYDELSPRVNAAIETLREKLLSEIRME